MSEQEAVRKQKAALRRAMLDWRKSVILEQQEPKNKRLLKQLLQSATYRQAEVIMAYLALPGEVNLDELIEQAIADGKTVCVPFLTNKPGIMEAVRIFSLQELACGPLGLRQPQRAEQNLIEPGSIELVCVPGVAFDRQGGRLGMGAGYYDRFLGLADQAMRMGVAWDEQIQPLVAREQHDLPMDALLTPTGIHLCGFGLPFA